MSLLFENLVATNKGEFLAAVELYAKQLAIDPNWLMMVMFSESSLYEKSYEPTYGGGGLIGFMPATAKEMGTTVADLIAMSNVKQLDYVYKFYLKKLQQGAKINSYTDLKLLTFYPAAQLKHLPDSYIFPDWVYKANPTFDITQNKQLTLGEFKQVIAEQVKAKVPPEFYTSFQYELSYGLPIFLILGGVLLTLAGLFILLYFVYRKS